MQLFRTRKKIILKNTLCSMPIRHWFCMLCMEPKPIKKIKKQILNYLEQWQSLLRLDFHMQILHEEVYFRYTSRYFKEDNRSGNLRDIFCKSIVLVLTRRKNNIRKADVSSAIWSGMYRITLDLYALEKYRDWRYYFNN